MRSEVRILSPRPIKSIIYGHQQWWPFLRCGKIVADPLTTDPHGLNSSSFSSISSMRVAACGFWIRVAHQISNRRLTKAGLSQPRPKGVTQIVPMQIVNPG